jgi:hypothetical protein
VADKALVGLQGQWLTHDVHDPDGRVVVSIWDVCDPMPASEQRAVFTPGIHPLLQPFVVGEYPT